MNIKDNKKIAFLFLIIDDISHPDIWTKYFEGVSDKINIYVHPKYPDKTKTPWLKQNIISDLEPTAWGRIVGAYYQLLKRAYEDPDNIKFITISESCLPFKPFNTLYYNLICDDEKTSYIKFMNISNYDRNERINIHKNKSYFKKVNFIKHYARFCLSRYHVEKLLRQVEGINFFKEFLIGDEFFLSLLNSNKEIYSDHIIDYAITYDNWTYVNKLRSSINEKIKKLYDKLESKPKDDETIDIKKVQNEIVELKKLKDDISKNPKSYDIFTDEDMYESYEINSFFWRKFPKTSNIINYYNQLIYPNDSHKIIIHDDKTPKEIISYMSKKYPDYFITNKSIMGVCSGQYHLPPFYHKIIVLNTKISTHSNSEDLGLLFNSLIIGGSLIIHKRYKFFYDKLSDDITQSEYNMVKITKLKNNIIQPPNQYRIYDFIIAGVQKGGTTSIAKNIMNHPDIFMPKDEVHYHDITYVKQTNKQMKQLFDYSKKIVGFRNPNILDLTQTHSRIQSFNPFVKLILILRNPISRAYSEWNMMIKNKNKYLYTKSFEESIDEELHYRIDESKTFYTMHYHFLQQGLYYKQIKELLKWFPKQNILILISEHVLDNMEHDDDSDYMKIYDFLNVDKIKLNYSKHHEGSYDKQIDEKLYNRLVYFFKEDVENLENFLGYKTNWFNQ